MPGWGWRWRNIDPFCPPARVTPPAGRGNIPAGEVTCLPARVTCTPAGVTHAPAPLTLPTAGNNLPAGRVTNRQRGSLIRQRGSQIASAIHHVAGNDRLHGRRRHRTHVICNRINNCITSQRVRKPRPGAYGGTEYLSLNP